MEFGSKNRFEAGQPINTDDAMNDMPKNANDVFAQRMQERVADGTYTQEEADKLLEKARARSEEKARNQAETDAYNAWANMTPADFEARENKVEEEYDPVSTFQIYPRMQGETSAEYGKRLSEIKWKQRSRLKWKMLRLQIVLLKGKNKRKWQWQSEFARKCQKLWSF